MPTDEDTNRGSNFYADHLDCTRDYRAGLGLPRMFQNLSKSKATLKSSVRSRLSDFLGATE